MGVKVILFAQYLFSFSLRKSSHVYEEVYRYMQKSRDVYTSRDHEMFQNLWFIKNIASYILLHYKYSLQSGWKAKVP